MELLVGIAVSAIDPLVLGGGIFLGYLAHRRMWSAAGILAVFAVIGLVLLQANGPRPGEMRFAFYQIVATFLVGGISFGICKGIAADRRPAK